MTNPVFPIANMVMKEDSQFYTVEGEDVAMKTPMDGGYVVSRAKHTRAPRKTFTTGFTTLRDADKAVLDAFYNTVRGGSVAFDWTDPSNGTVYTVRFAVPLKFSYAGIGPTKMWNCLLTLEQV